MTQNFVRVTYRELSCLLGVTPDAARMKAKREAAAGRWRLIRGDHPCDVVHVELSATELAELKRCAAERKERMPLHRVEGRQDRIAKVKRDLVIARDLVAAIAKVQFLEAELANLTSGHAI